MEGIEKKGNIVNYSSSFFLRYTFTLSITRGEWEKGRENN